MADNFTLNSGSGGPTLKTRDISSAHYQEVIHVFNSDGIYADGAIKTVNRAAVSASTSGDNTLVSAQGAGNAIRVTYLLLIANDDVTIRFEDGASGTALSGQMDLVANSGFEARNEYGIVQTSDNTLLNLELSAAVEVAGVLHYIVV